MKNLLKISAFIPLITLGGCYTQLALKTDESYYQDSYSYEDQDDTTYTEERKEVNIYNYYFDGPYYRRYYWGYYPGWYITMGTYFEPFWWDIYYPYVPWWYYPYVYNYWIYNDYYWHYPHFWYYGHYSPGIYKYRNIYTRLRNTDGGRNFDIYNRGDSYRSGRSNDNRIGSGRSIDVDLSKSGVSRGRDNSGTLSKESSNTKVERKRERNETRINYPVESTRDRTNRKSTRGTKTGSNNTSERSRARSGGNNSDSKSQPVYTPPNESRAPASSYNPPSRPSSGSSSRGSDGGRSGGGQGRRR